jgi:ATP-binding cassette, subfamily B, bacterial CvaB/MchF/RaxB
MNSQNASGLSVVRDLALGFRRKLPVILQTEATECGLACLAMIVGYHDHRIDLASLRRRYPVSQKGVALTAIIDIAGKLDMSTRAVRLELSHLRKLKLPCILHWDMNHFVVLRGVKRNKILIHDPAIGERAITLQEVSASFSGVALEVWPGQHFRKQDDARPVRIVSLLGKVTGVTKSFGQIIAIAFVLQILGLVSPLYTQWVIDHALVSGNYDLLTTLALGFGVLMLVTQAVSVLSKWASMYLSTTWSVQWNANIFTHLLRLPLSYFEKRHLGDVVSRFGSGGAIQSTLTTTLISSIVDGVMVILVTVLIFLYSPLLSWICIGAMTLYVLSRILWYRQLRLATQEQIVHSAKQSSHFLETVRGARAIKLYRELACAFGGPDKQRVAGSEAADSLRSDKWSDFWHCGNLDHLAGGQDGTARRVYSRHDDGLPLLSGAILRQDHLTHRQCICLEDAAGSWGTPCRYPVD